MRVRSYTAVFLLMGAVAAYGGECTTLGEQLRMDESRVKEYITKVGPLEQLSGLRLCDGSVLFEGWTLLRKAEGLEDSQSVYLFSDGEAERAVAWIEPGGKPLPVPSCPHGPSCNQMIESGTVISGDIYTWKTIRPGEEVVILWDPSSSW